MTLPSHSGDRLALTRSDAIRTFAKGEGMTTDNVARYPGLNRTFGMIPVPALIEIIDGASSSDGSRQQKAIRNALALDHEPGTLLKQRRLGYLVDNNISLRTLITHEEIGSFIVARMIVPDLYAAHVQELEDFEDERLDQVTKST